jgi:hypothetical protein
MATPYGLNYPFIRSDVETISDHGLRQIKTAECLANVLTNSNGNGYTIEFYTLANVLQKTNVLYPLTNSPYARVVVDDPTGQTNQLRVTQSRDGGTNIYEYHWLTNGWELISGFGLRTESKTTVWSETNTVRTVTTTIRQGGGNPVYQKVEKYRTNAVYGERLLEVVEGTGANA